MGTSLRFRPTAGHQIAPGVRGWLESPHPAAIVSDCLLVSGWAFATGTQVLNLWAVTGSDPSRPLRHGLRRDDVASVYADEPNATFSGFSAYLELDAQPGSPLPVEVWATLGDGRSVRLFKRLVSVSATGDGPASRGAGGESLLKLAARHAIEHPGILLSGRSWLHAFALLKQAATREPNQGMQSGSSREVLARASRAFLASFLAAESHVALTASAAPVVSVVVVVWNRADLTLKCLRALAEQTGVATEVILVDNASTDQTSTLLTRVGGLQVIRTASNLGFTVAANLGARAARGEFLLFLNNDAELVPGSVEQLLNTARRSNAIGAVGGKLVFPDGRLQEAGSIIWADGSCEAYGRGSDPLAPEYNFEREVDFCSGALLLTRLAVFEKLGGFDEQYRPAYYEDADYCVRLRISGYSIVYQPKAVAIHYEFGSAVSREASVDLQRARQPVFASRHRQWLSSQRSRADGVLAARSHPHGRPAVTIVDDAVPDPRMGAGFPRAAALMHTLGELGYLITIYVTGDGQQMPQQADRFPALEVVGGGPGGLRGFLTSRRHHDLVIVSRPHNMQYVKAAVGSDLSALGVPCVYDAEAIYALREIGRRRVSGQPLSDADGHALIDRELGLTRGCASVMAVSEAERLLFAARGVPNVFVVAHAVEPRPTPSPFERRRSILFVGAVTPDSPNEDAVLFLCRDVLPALQGVDASPSAVVVGGAWIPESLKPPAQPTVSWQADVNDLTALYDDARVFVAPMRYSAGIPLKVVEAAARGVPIVCTPLVAQQLGWIPGTELLTAESPTDWARAIASLYADTALWTRLREGALKRVASDYSPNVFRSALRTVLSVSTRSSASGR